MTDRSQSSRLVRADLHCHSDRSPDSRSTHDEIIAACLRRGINCLALTDHNELDGALELEERVLKDKTPLRVIPAEEIMTDRGEIIGYFLSERIPPRLSAAETIARIHDQGGVAAVPHPFDRLRGSRLAQDTLIEISGVVDIIEVLNARIHIGAHIDEARRFAEAGGLVQSAGSDAHAPWEIGGAGVEMEDFDDAASFLRSLRHGRIFGKTVTPLAHFTSTFNKLRDRR